MIECNNNRNFGQPALRGRRLTVYDIVTKVLIEPTLNHAIEDYEINERDAQDAINYCRKLQCKTDKNLERFCHGCILRTLSDGPGFDRNDYLQVKLEDQSVVISKDKEVIFLGTLEELEESELGILTWIIAEKLFQKYYLTK